MYKKIMGLMSEKTKKVLMIIGIVLISLILLDYFINGNTQNIKFIGGAIGIFLGFKFGIIQELLKSIGSRFNNGSR